MLKYKKEEMLGHFLFLYFLIVNNIIIQLMYENKIYYFCESIKVSISLVMLCMILLGILDILTFW